MTDKQDRLSDKDIKRIYLKDWVKVPGWLSQRGVLQDALAIMDLIE